MKNLCDKGNCPHGKDRKTCTELCKEAEDYANIDYVGREKAFNIRGFEKIRGAIKFRVPTDPEEKAHEIRLLRRTGKSYKDISIHLECTEVLVREVLDEN